ncbi:E3 ubiquitin-protein ligase TRIM35-like [Alosa sapidissima]|uniref:E3 ubiquitin-protein ligase TRIM35-like n=1 Tax=Alosa sapidissima TaxID=34773 RepID=UPI001C0A2E7F|nr:E3 ubiquitin-protein ligase TRIM35-like [Alosa sapidissima]
MATRLVMDLTCPVCIDIFKDPILLSCSHSVCKTCLQNYWKIKGFKQCPVCRRKCSKDGPPPNLALKNLCETFLQERRQTQMSCSLHKEKLEFFCQDDQQLMCLTCQDNLHKDHKFSPIDKAATDAKEELMVKLQDKLKAFEKAKDTCHKSAEYIKTQAEDTERQIKKQFVELHQFLQDQEATRIAALREEEEQKSQPMKEKIEKMSREISSLSDTIRAIEEMGADDVTFLQNYKSTVERAQCTLQDPERVSGPLINVAKHLGNLKFKVWQKMQNIVQYTPVILDPNTAADTVILSEDLTSLRQGDEEQQLPDNPERFDENTCVLGSEGFNSGTPSWDVEVGENTWWVLGVMTESLQRKGDYTSKNGRWFVSYTNGEYSVCAAPQPSTLLTVQQKLQRIRVQLDWDRGELSFSDPDNNTHLHTLTHTFTERVFPYIGIGCKLSPLRILPLPFSLLLPSCQMTQL